MYRKLAGFVAAFFALIPLPARAEERVSFARDIQPILSDKCYRCHGPDAASRKARLRLDDRESALAARRGMRAIVPAKPEESETWRRISSQDESEVMPPPATGKKLSPREIGLIRTWIEQGAKWEVHWAFEQPRRADLPKVAQPGWVRNPIDAFVLARLKRERLQPSPEAPRHVLIRRLSFDLTGLPPTPGEVTAFVNDKSPDAYDKLVDRLLASTHFGERLAMDWLDAARYADTDGFQSDATRTNWPWRDWVVDAFNRNLPYDQFTLEQFAGDLLPAATPEQKLATAFHRNHMTNGEGGRDPEESRVDYVVDRVNTTGTLWLGLTLGCSQCHDHKYDPVSQADYYRLYAFFNSIDEDGKAGRAAKPYLAYKSPYAPRALASAKKLFDDRKAAETATRQAAEPAFTAWLKDRLEDVRAGARAWRPFRATRLETHGGSVLQQSADGAVMVTGPDARHEDYLATSRAPLSRVTGFRLEVLPDPAREGRGLGRGKSGHFILTDIKVHVHRLGQIQVREVSVESAVADYSADPKNHGGYGSIKDTLDDDPRNGWANFDRDLREPRTAVFAFAEPLLLAADEELTIELRHRSTEGHANIGRFRLSVTDQPGEIVQRVGSAPLDDLAGVANPASLEPKLRARLLDQFLADHPPFVSARAALRRASAQLDEAKSAAKVDVMVLAEQPKPRDTYVLVRGVWDKKGDKVAPDAPGVLAPWPSGEPKVRQGLARWLTARSNPLTARVAVNRLWQQTFGAGLVRTPDDFGLQGERPTHPELLDWLAVELMDHGWDIKHLLRLIVTSATYRQSSDVAESLRSRDSENRLLARGARFRLPSWMIRDAALRTGGLLNPAIGGPPVRPYQPTGVWEDITMGRFKYEPTDGPEQYRRTLYAFWRRSAAPSFLFDTAQRRVCEVSAARTNTPLQALTLLNDTTYVEAARAVAAQAMATAPAESTRLAEIILRVLSRPARPAEQAVLAREYRRALEHYRSHPADATRWLQRGQFRADPVLDQSELAAYAVVANMVLNLDEAITRE